MIGVILQWNVFGLNFLSDLHQDLAEMIVTSTVADTPESIAPVVTFPQFLISSGK